MHRTTYMMYTHLMAHGHSDIPSYQRSDAFSRWPRGLLNGSRISEIERMPRFIDLSTPHSSRSIDTNVHKTISLKAWDRYRTLKRKHHNAWEALDVELTPMTNDQDTAWRGNCRGGGHGCWGGARFPAEGMVFCLWFYVRPPMSAQVLVCFGSPMSLT